jgi:glycosyltransferase involved in cell wall biosynthesis
MINRSQDEIVQNWPQNWENPTVSIRCTTYNQEAYISQALDGFLMQETTFPFEIVVHDDASTDRTAEIIRGYEKKFPKIIKPIYETENQYSKKDGSLRKIMDNACKGKYIAYCEGDDYWCDPHKLQMQYEAMEAHPECSLCAHSVQLISEKGKILEEFLPPKGVFNNGVNDQSYFAQIVFFKHNIQTSSYFLKKTTLQQNESIFSYPGNGDQKILRCCIKEGNFYFISKIMSHYRIQSNGSWTSRTATNSDAITELENNTINLNNLFDEKTQFKYHDAIQTGNKRLLIYRSIREKKFKMLFFPENIELSKKIFSPKWMKIYFILSKIPMFLVNLFYRMLPYLKKITKQIKEKKQK